MSELVILDDGQLRQLAKLVYYQEVDAIHSIDFSSEPELAAYLRDCGDSYNTVLNVLDSGRKADEEYKNDNIASPIANDIYSYIINAANLALQTVRNCSLRYDYLGKISENAGAFIKELGEVNGDLEKAQKLANDASEYRNQTLESIRKQQSTASREFSKLVKESGIQFDELVTRYSSKRYGKLFTELEEHEKLQVYYDIIEASGRGNVGVTRFATAAGAAGIAVLIFTAAMMVWDIFSSEHVLETATRDAVESAAAIGGAMLGEVVGAAVASNLIGVEATSVFVLLAGFATGIVGAFILGSFAGWLVGLIFGSGGKQISSMDGLKCYVSSMPDGAVLARQIASQ
ncbi:uncharacterized protein [Elaeis guineensis]|uniref:uncharacterized protein n=1 Tax=Elaeis guineensis var. tenera TaxID=51953 RepID=UPI003C6D5D68